MGSNPPLPPPPPPTPAVLPPPAPARRRGTVLPTIGVVLLLLVLALGGFVAAASVQLPVPLPVKVTNGVRIHPEPGWVVGETNREGEIKLVRLTSGAGNLDVFAGSFQGGAATLLETYLRDFLERDAQQLQVSDQRDSVTTRAGLGGVRLHYVGVFGERSQGIEGEVTAFVTASGVGVAFDAWAGQGQLDIALDDVHRMIDSAELS